MEKLIEATMLIGKAQKLIMAFYKENPELGNCLWGRVFESESMLEKTAFQISDMVGICFRDKYYFGSGKEVLS